MSGTASAPVRAMAAELFAVLGTGGQVAPFSSRPAGLAPEEAYRVAAEVHAHRLARGERPVGRKIGFTNRGIWTEYAVDRPMWGHVYDRTVADLAPGAADIPLAGLSEPRIEPEIVFGLARSPAPGMTPSELLGCLAWVAHGVEIVQSVYPGWRFAIADTIAAYGLHGMLRIGPRHPIGDDGAAWLAALGGLRIARDGTTVDRGEAGNVLGGPLHALAHLVELLGEARLAAGEVVTTGTLTRAFPVSPGERWHTAIAGAPLAGVEVRFV